MPRRATATLDYGTSGTRRVPSGVIGGAIVAVVFVTMLAFTWRTWPDPVVDFGRELYVPWQLAGGKVLYRDIAHFNGPLSPYVNSLVMRVGGVSLMSLVAANLIVLAGVTLLLHRILAKISDEFAASVACCAFLVLLATGQPGPAGNYNFITPYSHELTHGMLLSLAAIACVDRAVRASRPRADKNEGETPSPCAGIRWLAAAGALLGLAFLTKPEVFFAAAAAVVLGVALTVRRVPRNSLSIAALVGAAIAPPLIAGVLLSLAMPAPDAWGGVLGGWRWALDRTITSLPFYQRVRGTLDLGESLRAIAIGSIIYLAVIAVPAAAAMRLRASGARRIILGAVAFGIVLLTLLLASDWIDSQNAGHPLPIWQNAGRPLLVCSLVLVVITFRHLRGSPEPSAVLACLFAALALLLLAKIPLNVQLYHYGFALAAPALTLTIVSLQCWLPRWINNRGGAGSIVRGATLAAVLVLCVRYVGFMHDRYREKTVVVARGGDSFLADARGGSVNEIVSLLDRLPPQTTVATLPEGAMVNYLSRRTNPTPYIVLMPPEVLMFGQDRILAAYREHPPDVIVLVKSDAEEYGYRGFNVDYGSAIAGWIDANYAVVLSSRPDAALPYRVLKRR